MRIALPPRIDPGAFARVDRAAPIVDLDGETMGTSWSVRYAGRAEPEVLRQAIAARLAGLVAEMSHWSPTSLLSRFNRSAAGSWTTLPPDFAKVVARGLAIAAITGGAFDPAIGRLVDLWGFGPVVVAGPPDDAAIEDARGMSGRKRLGWVAPHLLQRGGVALDLSGIAKGHAVDAVADLLAAAGIADCLVEIGGELVGRGIRPDSEPWWVDLEPPTGIPTEPLRIALHSIAIATSGNYRRGAHTLDPRTGRPIGSGIVSASVIHATALEADAWATALTVLGATAGVALAERQHIAARLVDADGREYLTPALVAMLG